MQRILSLFIIVSLKQWKSSYFWFYLLLLDEYMRISVTSHEFQCSILSRTLVAFNSNKNLHIKLVPTALWRFRGRQLNLQTTTEPSEEPTPVAEERLPSNTRFPPRSRSNHNSATVTTPSSDEALTNRGRSSSGNGGSAATSGVRRPSLELVDSSSFRTHSSDVSRGQDLTSQSPSFPSVLPSGQWN